MATNLRDLRSRVGAWPWRENRYRLALWAVIALSILAQRIWIARNQAPPELLDDADHLLTSLSLYQTLSRVGLMEFIKQFLQSASHYYHPPLIPALTAPFYAVFGQSVAAALWVNAGFAGLLYVYLFKLVKPWAGERTALIAVTITALFPMTYGLMRIYLLEFGLAALAVVWLYYFYQSEGLAHRRYLPALGLLLGAGLLSKATFPMYIVGPVAWEILYPARAGDKTAFCTLGYRLLLVGGIGGLVALPWYWLHGDWVWKGAHYISGDLHQATTLKTALAGPALLSFGIRLIEEGTSVYFLTLGLVLWAGVLLHRRGEDRQDRVDRRTLRYGILFLLAGWTPPFLVCLLATEKVVRYLFPALPALAALLAVLIHKTVIEPGPASPVRRAAVLAALLLIPLGNFFQLSFFDVWTRLPEPILAEEPLGLLEHSDGREFTFRPRREPWPLETILDILAAHTTKRPPQEIRGTIYYTQYPLIPANIMFAGMARNIPVVFFPLICDPMPLVACLEEGTDREFLIIEQPTMQWFELEDVLGAGLVPYRARATVRLPGARAATVVIYQRYNPESFLVRSP